MLDCKGCGAALDLTATRCPSCGAELEVGGLAGILGIVCRRCESYNEPGAPACAGCGEPFAATRSAAPRSPAPPARVTLSTGKPAPCPPAPVPAGTRTTRPMSVAPDPRPGSVHVGELAPGAVALVLVHGEGSAGAVHLLDREELAVGRAPPGIAFPGDPCLAPRHATLLFRGGGLWLRDEDAPGGVFLRLRGLSVPLRPGDLFAMGDRLLRHTGPLAPGTASDPDGTRRLGSPRPLAPAIVVEEVLEGGATGRVHVCAGPRVRIGRGSCELQLADDPYVSQLHAEIAIDGEGGAKLRDLGSSNGTFLRVPPRAERELRDGDVVRIGREVLRVAAISAR